MSMCRCVCECVPTILYQMMDVLEWTSATSSLFSSIDDPGVSLVILVSPLIAPVWRQQSLIRDPFAPFCHCDTDDRNIDAVGGTDGGGL